MILTQRLCVFFHLEVTAYLSNQAVRAEAYAIQDENLEIQHKYLASDYAAMFSAERYPSYIGDISHCQQLIQDAERQSLSERRRHIARILKTLKAENEAGNALLQRLRPYLPSQHSRRGLVLADLHDGPPTPKRTTHVPPVPVHLARNNVSTRPGLHRSDLDTSLTVPGHYAHIPTASLGRGGGCTGFKPQWLTGGGGGGGSGSDADSTASPILIATADDYQDIPGSPSPSPRSTSPSSIPPPPSLTIPSSFVDPTHNEAYPPSNNTSTVIDTFITNPFTLSGTFSLTLTPNQSTNVTLTQPLLTGADQMTTPLLSHEFGWDSRPPDEDVDTTDQYERTAYDYGETDVANTSSRAPSPPGSDARDSEDGAEDRQYGDLSADSASQSSHASSAADSAPLDNHHEEYIDWLCAGCPASDTEYISDSDSN
jgi:hypothetical protein